MREAENIKLFEDAETCRELFEDAGDLIQSVDENGRFLYVNKKWRETLGYSFEEALRMGFPDIIHQNHLQACYMLFAQLKQGKSLNNVKTQFVAKNGRVIDVIGNISVRMKDGKFLSTWGIFHEEVPHTETETILREEQKFSQALIDSLPSIFYVFEVPSLKMVRWNRALTHIFNFSNEETANMTPINFIAESDKGSAEQLIRDIIKKGKSAAELSVNTKGGRLVPYYFSAVYTTIADKGYVVGIGIDITDLRKREEELDRAAKALVRRDFELMQTNEEMRLLDESYARDEALLASIGEGMMAIDEKERVLMMSPAAYAILDASLIDVVGKHWREVLRLEDETGAKISMEKDPIAITFSSGKRTISRDFYLASKKAKFPTAVVVSPIRLRGKISGAIVVFHDITEEKERDREKTEFISFTSHQLKTPLTIIKWYSEMLRDGKVAGAPEKQEKYIHTIQRNTERVIELVNSLLDVSRLEMGIFTAEVRDINFQESADAALQNLANEIEKKKLKISREYVRNLPVVSYNPRAIQIILDNLISNAVRYTPDGGTVTISITQPDDELLIKVSDTGIGIPAEAQAGIFNKFFRAENAKRSVATGSGLGLYMVKTLLEKIGGKIWFESKEGRGTVFYVSLPLSSLKNHV